MPTFCYTGYEDGDKRADASMVVTGSDGKGTEALINFKSGSRLSGGIACNKWDENRVTPEPYTVKQRNTGMNYQMRRIENVMMMLAEADVALGGGASIVTGNSNISLQEVKSGTLIPQTFLR